MRPVRYLRPPLVATVFADPPSISAAIGRKVFWRFRAVLFPVPLFQQQGILYAPRPYRAVRPPRRRLFFYAAFGTTSTTHPL